MSKVDFLSFCAFNEANNLRKAADFALKTKFVILKINFANLSFSIRLENKKKQIQEIYTIKYTIKFLKVVY